MNLNELTSNIKSLEMKKRDLLKKRSDTKRGLRSIFNEEK